jgi:hypothetical protein
MVPIDRSVDAVIPVGAAAQILCAFEFPKELTVVDKDRG